MGTNYYHRTNICDCCGRYDERHICKSLVSFEGVVEWPNEPPYDPRVVIGSWAEWKRHLRETAGQVWSEYGDQIDIEDFIERVETTHPDARRKQHKWMVMHQATRVAKCPTPDMEWLDPDGFSFYGGGFS